MPTSQLFALCKRLLKEYDKVAKKGNLQRVQAAATSWGGKGVRIRSICLGTIVTRMEKRELENEYGHYVCVMFQTADLDVLGCWMTLLVLMAVFLDGNQASFVNGSDFLVDGGAVSAALWNAEKDQETESSRLGELTRNHSKLIEYFDATQFPSVPFSVILK
jgi:hypothetical protein